MLKLFSLIAIPITFIILIMHFILFPPPSVLFLFLFPEIYILVGTLTLYSFLHLRAWKYNVYNVESDVFETIAYRKKTSIKNIAKVKKVKEKMVEQIINRLIEQEKLFGIIKDGLFISDKSAQPICSLCHKNITDSILLVLCPYCKRPFHKDHLIDYLNDVENKCPSCEHLLKLGDIFEK